MSFLGPLYGLKLHLNKEFNEYIKDLTSIIEKFMKDEKKQIYCIFNGNNSARICVIHLKKYLKNYAKKILII